MTSSGRNASETYELIQGKVSVAGAVNITQSGVIQVSTADSYVARQSLAFHNKNRHKGRAFTRISTIDFKRGKYERKNNKRRRRRANNGGATDDAFGQANNAIGEGLWIYPRKVKLIIRSGAKAKAGLVEWAS